MQASLLIQFAKAPVAGQVKTRMLPALSPEQALSLHSDLVDWTCRSLVDANLGPVELAVTGDTRAPLFEHCRQLGVTAVREQRGQDLGQRMFNALADGLGRFRKVVLVGSDCPQIDASYLAQAIALLDDNEVVLGPADDGGYVLIGVTGLNEQWFEDIRWGSATVYADTIARLDASGSRWSALPVLQDIDRPEDLPVWHALAGAG